MKLRLDFFALFLNREDDLIGVGGYAGIKQASPQIQQEFFKSHSFAVACASAGKIQPNLQNWLLG